MCSITYQKEVSKQLLHICQGERSVSEYTLELHILAAESEWNETALQTVFHQELKRHILNELACRNESLSLD